MDDIFLAKTIEGHIIKILTALLQNIIRETICLELNQEGIHSTMMNSQRNVLVDIHLSSNNFNIYKCTEPQYIGLNLKHLYASLKEIKRKDTVSLSIAAKDNNTFNIITESAEKLRHSRGTVHIQTVQNVRTPTPNGYDQSIVIPSSEYQRTMKDICDISNVVKLSFKKYSIMFACSVDGVVSRETQLGDFNDQSEIIFSDEYNMEILTRIVKMSGLCGNIYISCKKGLPLYVKSNVGSLGTIGIYIKSISQIKNEQ
jgi:proliferating cell nuclear antigen PCNA